MLQWTHIFNFYLVCIILSLTVLNKHWISLLLLSEVILLLLFFICLAVAGWYNIYYLLFFSFFVLILGGLELALNILLLIV